jgi:hypothetical protein
MRFLREVKDLLKYFVWAAIVGGLIEILNKWLPFWPSIALAVIISIVATIACYRLAKCKTRT